MRPVRLGDAAFDDIKAQVPADRVEEFRLHDLRPVLEALSEDDAIWDEVGIPRGPGRRFTLAGRTVAGFHLFITNDPADPRPDSSIFLLGKPTTQGCDEQHPLRPGRRLPPG